MIEKLLALAPKTANCKLHFFVPFNFREYSFLPVLQILIKFSNTSLCSTPYLPLAIDEPLVGGELLESHRATGTKFLGGDAYLGTKTELGTIGERGGSIPIDTGGIDTCLELAGTSFVIGNDAFTVSAAILGNVGQDP